MTKTVTALIAALTLATALTFSAGQAQAHSHHFGPALGIGFAAGALIGAAAASSAYYAEPVYECRYVERYDRWGRLRVVKVCSAY
jgi:anaerobic C4-dicarboxylate transporter